MASGKSRLDWLTLGRGIFEVGIFRADFAEKSIKIERCRFNAKCWFYRATGLASDQAFLTATDFL
jgi:hypothetical protein